MKKVKPKFEIDQIVWYITSGNYGGFDSIRQSKIVSIDGFQYMGETRYLTADGNDPIEKIMFYKQEDCINLYNKLRKEESKRRRLAEERRDRERTFYDSTTVGEDYECRRDCK